MASTTSQIPSLRELAGLAGLLVGLLLAGLTPANAEKISWDKDYKADVTFSPAELVLNCVETLRPDDTPKVTLELIEVPEEIIPKHGPAIIGWVNFVTEKMDLANFSRALAKHDIPVPQELHMFNQRFKGRMEIKYRFDNNPLTPEREQRLEKDGYKRLEDRKVTVGDREVTIARWYKHNSKDIRSYGRVAARITLRSPAAETNTKPGVHKYKPRYRLAGRIEWFKRDTPSDKEGRLKFAELERAFKARMRRLTKKIVAWLNQARPLFANVEAKKRFFIAEEGTVVDSAVDKDFDVEEINFPFCRKSETVVPRIVLTAGRFQAVTPEGDSGASRPLGE